MNKRFADYFDVVDKKKARNRTALGVVLGVATGVAAGLLFAPQSGEETREDIMFALEEGASKTKSAAKTAGEFTLDKAHDARQALASVLSKLDDKIRKMRGHEDDEFFDDDLFDDDDEDDDDIEEETFVDLKVSEEA